jgi:hypothetical protein
MQLRIAIPLLAALAAISPSSVSAGPITIINSGFEVPDLGSGGNAYGYVGTQFGGSGPISASTPGIGWTFSSQGAAIAANHSDFSVNGAPNGNSDGGTSTVGQAGVIQGGDGTFNSSSSVYIEQLLNGFQGGTATISFLAFGRHLLGPNTIDVYLDSSLVGSVTPPVSVFTPESFTVDVASGSHTLRFVGNNHLGGDSSSFIDSVGVANTPTPQPATVILLGSALLLIGGHHVIRWRGQSVASARR